MIDAYAPYSILLFAVIYAAAFFLLPHRVAQFWERDTLPVHWIMRHFQYWEGRRVWISGVSFVACVIIALSFAGSVIAPITIFIGLVALVVADAFQVRQLSQGLPNWSPTTAIDQNGRRLTPILDVLFGEKPNRDGKRK